MSDSDQRPPRTSKSHSPHIWSVPMSPGLFADTAPQTANRLPSGTVTAAAAQIAAAQTAQPADRPKGTWAHEAADVRAQMQRSTRCGWSSQAGRAARACVRRPSQAGTYRQIPSEPAAAQRCTVAHVCARTSACCAVLCAWCSGCAQACEGGWVPKSAKGHARVGSAQRASVLGCRTEAARTPTQKSSSAAPDQRHRCAT